jgi:hypothetical protein
MMTATLDIRTPSRGVERLPLARRRHGVAHAFNAPYSGQTSSGPTFKDDASSSWARPSRGGQRDHAGPSYRPSPLAAFGLWLWPDSGTSRLRSGHVRRGPAQRGVSHDRRPRERCGSRSRTARRRRGNTGGRMGDSYANMMTLVAGEFPNGWLHGVDELPRCRVGGRLSAVLPACSGRGRQQPAAGSSRRA